MRTILTRQFAKAFCFSTLLLCHQFLTAQLKYDPQKAKAEAEVLKTQAALAGSKQPNLTIKTPAKDYTLKFHDDLIIINYNPTSTTIFNTFLQQLTAILELKSKDKFVFVSSDKDNLGFTHYLFSQYYDGIPVMGGQFLLHEKDGKLTSANGKFYKDLNIDTKPATAKETAIRASVKFVGAKKYRWENKDEETALKSRMRNTKATYYPSPELVIAPKDGIYKKENFRLCFKVNISAELPYIEQDIFVNAHTGEVISKLNKISNFDVNAVNAKTFYYGDQQMTTDKFLNGYRLKETVRPIQTLNMLNKTDYSKAIDFTDQDNNWNSNSTTLRYLSIVTLKTAWRDAEDLGNGPDITIEITDANGNFILRKNENLLPNTSAPLAVNIDNIPLLTGGLYTLKIWDADVLTSDDLLGQTTFNAVNGVKLVADGLTTGFLLGTTSNSGALDAHWGMEKVYDYYKNEHGRASYDGRNGQITTIIHPNAYAQPELGSISNNAFWDGSNRRMVFGDGGFLRSSIASLDICGHEMTHAFISNNGKGGLDYNGESGALNESFADIFGATIEFNTLNSSGNWTQGEKTYLFSDFDRSLEDPNAKGQPKTYGGKYWENPNCIVTRFNDHCYVHQNSGVQNKWYHLLTVGGTGTIENTGLDYEVPAIGLTNAAKIAYNNMMTKLSNNATYQDAYIMSLQSAIDNGFSTSSMQYRANRESWFAVGVAKQPEINSFNPPRGRVGTTVVLKGKNYNGISFVGFNGVYVDATKFSVSADETEITVDVPPGASTGYISVIAGYDTVQSADKFIIECVAPLSVIVSSADASTFTVQASGGTEPYTFSIDNVNFQESNTFTGLATGRSYTIYVKDASGCSGQNTFLLNNPIQCNVQSGSGGQGTTFTPQILGTTAGSVTVSYQMYTIPDQMDIYYNNVLVATTGRLLSGTGTLTFDYNPPPGGPYACFIRMFAPNSGTAWDFIAYCPVPKLNVNALSSGQISGKDSAISKMQEMSATIYPNPAIGDARLSLEGIQGTVSVILTDIAGKELWRTTRTGSGITTLPVGVRKSGLYFVSIVNQNGEKKTLKLILSK